MRNYTRVLFCLLVLSLGGCTSQGVTIPELIVSQNSPTPHFAKAEPSPTETPLRFVAVPSITPSPTPTDSPPDVLTGYVVDKTTGLAIEHALVLAKSFPDLSNMMTIPLTGTAILQTETNAEGAFQLPALSERVQLQILMPGYRKEILNTQPSQSTYTFELIPFDVKAVYLTTYTASDTNMMEDIFSLLEATELNAIVIDVKLDALGEVGKVAYASQLPQVKDSISYLDMHWIVQEARAREIYTIARMPIMRDDALARTQPDWAIKRPDGGPWYDRDGIFWIDPFQRDAWQYNIALAQEIARFGFDEIQFDYIRFPADENTHMMVLSQPIFPEENPNEMYTLLAEYLEQAHKAINAEGTFFSVDVFGLVTWRPMWEIGQKLDLMMPHVDYLCPMIYPSLYSPGDVGYEKPDAFPYEIVLKSLRKGQKQAGDQARAQFRPWLQAFDAVWLAGYTPYNRENIQAQIQAVEDFHKASGWSLWNPLNEYDINWFKP